MEKRSTRQNYRPSGFGATGAGAERGVVPAATASSSRDGHAGELAVGSPGGRATTARLGETTQVIDDERSAERLTFEVSLPLVGEAASCAGCAQRGRDAAFLTQRDYINHMKRDHADAKIGWVCRVCRAAFKGSHGVLCHFPKCKGVPEERAYEHVCEQCGQSFRAARGLSIHEMHVHPTIRNRKRQEPKERPRRQLVPRNRAWTEDEVRLLEELDARYSDERYPNVAIRQHLGNKTLKQISDKRRELRARGRQPDARVQEQEDNAQGEDTGTTGEEETEGNVEVKQDEDPGNEAVDEWRAAIWEYAMSVSLPETTMLRDLNDEINTLLERMKENPARVEAIDAFIEERLTPRLLERVKPTAKESVRSRRGNKGGSTTHSSRKRFTYARHQDMFHNCPGRLADLAIDGKMSGSEARTRMPPGAQVKDFYDALWGTEGPEVPPFEMGDERVPLHRACPAIAPIDVAKRIGRIKKDSARGPDQIGKCHLQVSGAKEILAKLYNILLYTGHYPRSWRNNRTTLLPKPGKDLAKVESWRPITIGSMMARVMSGILDQRCRNFVTQSRRQKGFVAENGCKHNNVLLDRAISQMKTGCGGVIVVVDISKAFDTVPHSVIETCMRRKGVPELLAKYTRNMYSDCKTTIRASEGSGSTVMLRRGVKQGDPLSPLIFNMAVEPILDRINTETGGLSIGNTNVSILAFADDMVLIASNRQEAVKQIGLLGGYLEGMGMALATPKCRAFQVVPRDKTWFIKNPEIIVRGSNIPYCEPNETLSYLGANLNPWTGLIRDEGIPKLVGAVKNVTQLRLKPHQKLTLLKTYVMPHFIHGLVACPPAGTALRTMDGDIRQVIKQMLHLPASTTDGLLYTPIKSGGLGVPRLEHLVKLAVLRSAAKAAQTDDPALEGAMDDSALQKELKTYANSLRINWPATIEDLEQAKNRLKKEELDRWQSLDCQGHGVADFRNDKIGNTWLRCPTLLKPSRFLDALRLRTNTFGTKVVLHRADKNVSVECRRCRAMPETLAHIVGNCIHTKPMRMKRHDDIKDLIANNVSKNCKVFSEPSVNVRGELKKPDLVIKDRERLFVVDVTVRYENDGTLHRAFADKSEKYQHAAQYIQEKLKCRESAVLPVVVGSRGALPRRTVENLTKLGICKKDMLTISLIALRSTIELANAFIDYDKIR